MTIHDRQKLGEVCLDPLLFPNDDALLLPQLPNKMLSLSKCSPTHNGFWVIDAGGDKGGDDVGIAGDAKAWDSGSDGAGEA